MLSMNSAVVQYSPQPSYMLPVLVVLMAIWFAYNFVKAVKEPEEVWVSTGRAFSLEDPEDLPPDMFDAAFDSGALSVELKEHVYSSGKIAWRFTLNGRHYYPSRTQVRKRS
jgi:hypothetical protein